MNFIIEILITASPLLAASCGALISEFAGVMAIFIDSMINLSAFLFFAGKTLSGNIIVGFIVALVIPEILVFLTALFTEKFKANPFVTALALSLFSTGLISFLSSVLFNSRGVLTSPEFVFDSQNVRIVSSVFIWGIVFITSFLIFHSPWGIRIRIVDSNPDLLSSRGISIKYYKITSWLISVFFAAVAGCTLSMRLSSFVPEMSSGRGWMALAAVFLGRKNGLGIVLAVFVFSAAEYFSNLLPSLLMFANLPSSISLAMPFIACLILIIVSPRRL